MPGAWTAGAAAGAAAGAVVVAAAGVAMIVENRLAKEPVAGAVGDARNVGFVADVGEAGCRVATRPGKVRMGSSATAWCTGILMTPTTIAFRLPLVSH